ncbi:MAG TPA: 30S ribosomal protein S6 [Anaerolineaceae bacterium]|jgi:small subunit ribosomal protein S6|nr:30S ribosomal protein S6 [Longilinea sp.]HNZ12936.1 30S ribosomal protein S6 [Anaerolineaceae bacterium]HOD04128.1 30S ribosomal protein S6 [Anaerolineaceae bacterium]HOG79422.1 30S ribosomal protein S6 [Anaerolineaceae bacterium]HQN42599.1 30S ribosomal protein S6 [Anaerolineaceae bacterium]
MRNYEVIVILNPELEESAVTALIEKIKGWIVESGGAVSQVDMWGKRRMAYLIRKQREGQYVLLHAQFAPAFAAELERNLRFQEVILRFLISNVE